MCPVARCRPWGSTWLVLSYLLINVVHGLTPEFWCSLTGGPGATLLTLVHPVIAVWLMLGSSVTLDSDIFRWLSSSTLRGPVLALLLLPFL